MNDIFDYYYWDERRHQICKPDGSKLNTIYAFQHKSLVVHLNEVAEEAYERGFKAANKQNENIEDIAYEKGYHDAEFQDSLEGKYDIGFEDGYNQGYQAGFEDHIKKCENS